MADEEMESGFELDVNRRVIIIAFAGTLPGVVLGSMILTHWVVKTLYEVIATPLTYAIVTYLKKKEGIDTYDCDTNFNPLLVTE